MFGVSRFRSLGREIERFEGVDQVAGLFDLLARMPLEVVDVRRRAVYRLRSGLSVEFGDLPEEVRQRLALRQESVGESVRSGLGGFDDYIEIGGLCRLVTTVVTDTLGLRLQQRHLVDHREPVERTRERSLDGLSSGVDSE